MKLNLDRETLLKPLQAVQGVVERRQTLPILANVLLSQHSGKLSVTATDMELELIATLDLDSGSDGDVTVPARKLIDICRALPGEAQISLQVEQDRAVLRAGRSRFTLSTLPAQDYPSFDSVDPEITVKVTQAGLKRLIELTHFAMAHQDVRYYLNGLMLEISTNRLRSVATDGHRLAIADLDIEVEGLAEPRSVILPRKGVTELMRLLGNSDEVVELQISANQVKIDLGVIQFTSKLIDGKFPDYERVIPKMDESDKRIDVDRELLRQSLARASILSNDKYRAIRLSLEKEVLRLVASNPEQEEAEDEVEVVYDGEGLEIGFNVSYLIDALTVLPAETASIYLTDASSSCLITSADAQDCQYVVMPMRL